jgi:hypothetical protein
MEEIEVPVDQAQEKIMEEAKEARQEYRWISWVALSSALLAVVAAVAALLAGHHANEALIEQIQSSDRWSYYQAKGIKASVLGSKVQLLKEMGRTPLKEDLEKLEQYKKDQEDISKDAKEKEDISKGHFEVHSTFAKSVTFFQIAIAVSAISVLIRRRRFWFVSLAFALIGVIFFGEAFLGSFGGFH